MAAGQVMGHELVNYWGVQILKEYDSGLFSIIVGVALGLAISFGLIWIGIGFIWLAGKLGLIDLNKYNAKYPGFH